VEIRYSIAFIEYVISLFAAYADVRNGTAYGN